MYYHSGSQINLTIDRTLIYLTTLVSRSIWPIDKTLTYTTTLDHISIWPIDGTLTYITTLGSRSIWPADETPTHTTTLDHRSIWPIDGTQIYITTPIQCGPGSTEKGWSTFCSFPKLEHHNQIQFSVIITIPFFRGGCLTPLQRSGDALSETLIVLGNGIGYPNSKPERNCLPFISNFFSHAKATSLEEGKLWIQTASKTDLV